MRVVHEPVSECSARCVFQVAARRKLSEVGAPAYSSNPISSHQLSPYNTGESFLLITALASVKPCRIFRVSDPLKKIHAGAFHSEWARSPVSTL